MDWIFAGVVAYVVLQLVFGVVLSRRIKNTGDYLLAGRSFGYGLGIASTFATWFGAETCIGAAGAVYAGGIYSSTADPFGYALCLLIMGVFFAGRLRKANVTTIADHFKVRYAPSAERLVVLLMAPTSVIWAAAQLRAFGQVLSSTSGWSIDATLMLATGVVLIYTMLGGMLSDAVTDLVQGVCVVVGLGLLLAMVVAAAGGIEPAVASIDPGRLVMFDRAASPLAILEAWAIPVCGSVVAQELVARVLAARSPKVAKRSCYGAAAIYLTVGCIPLFLGLVGARLLPGLAEPEQILPALATRYLPGLLYVTFVGAIISAILSTVDSCLLAAGALVAHNLVIPLLGTTSERQKMLLLRGAVFCFGIMAWALARGAEGVYGLVEQASSFGSSGIFVVLVFGTYTRFGGPRAAVATLIAGGAVWGLGDFVFGIEAPYLTSLFAAVLTYVGVGAMERVRVMQRATAEA